MDFNSSTYNRYKDTRVSLYPKKSLSKEIGKFKWEVIIPFLMVIIAILWIVCMQAPTGLA